MTDDRDRLDRTFAGLRGNDPDPDDTEGPTTAAEKPQAPTSDSEAEEATTSIDKDGDQPPLFINPERPPAEGAKTDPGNDESDEDEPAVAASGSKATEDRVVRPGGDDPWTAAGVTLRKMAPAGDGDSQEVMAQIRRDIAYQQGKKLPDGDERKPASDTEHPRPKEDVNVKRSKSAASLFPSFSLSLPALGQRSVSIAQTLMAIAAVVFAVAFGASQIGVGGGKHYIHFTVDAPSAREVSVLGDFNDWREAANPLSRAPGSTVWEAWIAVEPGRYRYAFLVDGRVHMVDRARQASFDDELNRGVSILVVPGGGGVPDMIGDEEAAAETTLVPDRR